jgi:flagellar protein FlbD
MIELTRLNGSPVLVNCDLIRFAEAAPDTLLTLVTGEKVVVKEACAVVARKTLTYRAEVLRSAWPEAWPAIAARLAWDAEMKPRAVEDDEVEAG